MKFSTLLFVFLYVSVAHAQQGLPQASPEETGLDRTRLQVIDRIVQEGLDRKRMPGAVVLLARRGKIAFHKAYGFLQLQPEKVPMRRDTVFDMASITKPVATATSVMQLVERGLIALDDPVAKHIPEFAVGGKAQITIRQLLTHVGGLIPDNHIRDYKDGREKAVQRVMALDTWVEPGSKFAYSDVGFIVLGELVQRLTNQNIHEYSRDSIFRPLNMQETGYLPASPLKTRAAVTQQRDGKWMQGAVHDPRAYAMDGIAGHAGLFSTATDLAIYGQMMLNEGTWNGNQILKPETVKQMTAAYSVPANQLRGLGWDKRSAYSSNRGDLLSDRAFGHGGFTGTVLWIDPDLDLVFVFLSNRVHPDGKGSVNALAGRIATIAASAVTSN